MRQASRETHKRDRDSWYGAEIILESGLILGTAFVMIKAGGIYETINNNSRYAVLCGRLRRKIHPQYYHLLFQREQMAGCHRWLVLQR